MPPSALISIIVPVYNSEKYLQRCINSILAQTYAEFELLLVDDGSSDSSGRICDDFASRDNRIKVLHHKNGGPGTARNSGLGIATGEYISFIDSDDFIIPETLERIIEKARKHDADVVQFGYEMISSKGESAGFSNFKEKIILGQPECALAFSRQRILNNFSVNKLYKYTLIKDIRFPELYFSEDTLFLLKVFCESTKVVIINDPLYKYVKSPESLTQTAFSPKKLDIIKSGKLLYDYCISRYPQLAPYWALYIAFNTVKLYSIISRMAELKSIQDELIKDFKTYYQIAKNGDALSSLTLKSRFFLSVFPVAPKLYSYLYNKTH